MPSEHPVAQQLPPQEPSQVQQIKLCSSCHRPLAADTPAAQFRLQDADDTASETSNNVCAPCRTRLLTARIESPIPTARGEVLITQLEREFRRRTASLQPALLEDDGPVPNHLNQQQQPAPVQLPPQRCLDLDSDSDMGTASEPSVSFPNSLPSSGPLARPPPRISVQTSTHKSPASIDATPLSQAPAYSHAVSSPVAASPLASTSKAHYATPYADPLADITRLRVRSQGHHCLYPGAVFQGTQKSGRNSYDVNVTIVVRLFPPRLY